MNGKKSTKPLIRSAKSLAGISSDGRRWRNPRILQRAEIRNRMTIKSRIEDPNYKILWEDSWKRNSTDATKTFFNLFRSIFYLWPGGTNPGSKSNRGETSRDPTIGFIKSKFCELYCCWFLSIFICRTKMVSTWPERSGQPIRKSSLSSLHDMIHQNIPDSSQWFRCRAFDP